MDSFIIYNHAMLTTSAFAPVALGTSLKTQLQLATATTRRIYIDSWGYALDAAPSAASKIELLRADVAATGGTSISLSTGVQKVDPASPDCTCLQSGAALTAHSMGAEGTITASALLDFDELPANPSIERCRYTWVFPPNRRPIIAASGFARIRTTMGSAVNGLVWIRITD